MRIFNVVHKNLFRENRKKKKQKRRTCLRAFNGLCYQQDRCGNRLE